MKENTMKNSDAYYKYIEKYNETYGHIPSGQYMFILDELDTNKRNITELNNILNKTGVSLILKHIKLQMEKNIQHFLLTLILMSSTKFRTEKPEEKKK